MIVVRVFIWILEFLFFGGIIGSAIVVLLTGIEDIREVAGGHKEAKHKKEKAAQVAPITSPHGHTA